MSVKAWPDLERAELAYNTVAAGLGNPAADQGALLAALLAAGPPPQPEPQAGWPGDPGRVIHEAWAAFWEVVRIFGRADAGLAKARDAMNAVLARAYAPRVEVTEETVSLLKRTLFDGALSPDHMTACERTMGRTHPCTCGADEARAFLARLEGGEG